MVIDALQICEVNTYYGDSHILHDLSFTLRSERILALLGRNGVGKTTCIKSIMGFLTPRRGSICLFGDEIIGMSPEKIVALGVGFVPQGRRIFPTLTVRENLSVAARKSSNVAGKSWTAERVFDTFPRLRDRQSNLGGKLSGGEQQMLAIGRALMTNPKVLLFDEPSEGLAPQIVHDLQEFIRGLKGEGLSIILVEQNTRLAFEVADDVVVLDTTGVIFEGTVDEIRDKPDFLNAQLGVC